LPPENFCRRETIRAIQEFLIVLRHPVSMAVCKVVPKLSFTGKPFCWIVVLERSEVSFMTRNTRRARAIAIAQAKPNAKIVALRYLMLASGATAALVTLLLSHLI
jgi:hypothetical protein